MSAITIFQTYSNYSLYTGWFNLSNNSISLFSHSFMSDSVFPWTAAHQASLSFTYLPEFAQTHVHDLVMPSSHLILCCPLMLLPSIFPIMMVFSSQLALWIRWPKFWSFNFSLSPSNEYSGLISCRIDWFDLVVQRTLESSLAAQSKSINSWVLNFLYGPTLTLIHNHWKKTAFTIWIFVCKVMSLLFNTLSRFIIAFLKQLSEVTIIVFLLKKFLPCFSFWNVSYDCSYFRAMMKR